MGSILNSHPYFKSKVIDEYYLKLNSALLDLDLTTLTSLDKYYVKLLKFHIGLELGVFLDAPEEENSYRVLLLKDNTPAYNSQLPTFPGREPIKGLLKTLKNITNSRLIFWFYCEAITRSRAPAHWSYLQFQDILDSFVASTPATRHYNSDRFL